MGETFISVFIGQIVLSNWESECLLCRPGAFRELKLKISIPYNEHHGNVSAAISKTSNSHRVSIIGSNEEARVLVDAHVL